MTRIALALLIYASLASAQPWQWILTNPNWQNPTNFPQISPEEFPVCLADVSGDGLTDVLQFGVHIYSHFQTEDGVWLEWNLFGGPDLPSQFRVTAQNLDGDPAQELVFFPSDTSSILCYKLNMTEGPWYWDERPDLIEGRIPTLANYIYSMTWGNFDHDGNEEVAILLQTHIFTDALYIYQRTSVGEPWTHEYDFEFTNLAPLHQYAGDFDHDGDTDLAVQISVMSEYEGTMIFENSETGIQWPDLDIDLLGPGGGDLDGDGEWEFLYLNTCDVHLFYSTDGPYLLETTGLHEYSNGRNLREVSQVIGNLREPNGSYVAGVSTFFCFNSWTPNSFPHTEVINISQSDYRQLFTLPDSPYSGLSMADINGDGLQDLVGAYHCFNGWYDVRWAVLMNIGDELVDMFHSLPGAQFIIDDRYFPTEFASPQIGDIDGDNHAELILSPLHGDDFGTIQVFRIEQLTPEQILTRMNEFETGLPDSVSSYEVTDLDGDGLAEIVLIENERRSVYFFRNGQWETYADILPEITGDIRGFADWDNNGMMDIFADDGIHLNMTPSAADDPVVAPSSFKLSSYPNPFNAQTTITFDLPRAGDVTLTLFDVLGREVETLLDEPVAAGTHTHRFTATQLPSGVYFARLSANSITATHKLLLLK